MITCRADYRRYLAADRKALVHTRGIKDWLTNDVWRFQRALRRFEYQLNARPRSARRVVAHIMWRRKGRQLGFTIPPNVFGPGLAIAHPGTIVVNGGARVGAHCRLHVGVNIGTTAGKRDEAPIIGEGCYLGPGAVLFGPITIGDYVAVGANAVVTKDFSDGYVTLGGAPASVISPKSSEGL